MLLRGIGCLWLQLHVHQTAVAARHSHSLYGLHSYCACIWGSAREATQMRGGRHSAHCRDRGREHSSFWANRGAQFADDIFVVMFAACRRGGRRGLQGSEEFQSLSHFWIQSELWNASRGKPVSNTWRMMPLRLDEGNLQWMCIWDGKAGRRFRSDAQIRRLPRRALPVYSLAGGPRWRSKYFFLRICTIASILPSFLTFNWVDNLLVFAWPSDFFSIVLDP